MADGNYEGNFSDLFVDALSRGLKMEQNSPTAAAGGSFAFSRASSIGSVNAISCSSASSTHNTDDEDSEGLVVPAMSYKERRRNAHTHAEQKRRDAIKKGYDELQAIVPMCQTTDANSQKLSKATVLQRSIDYIQFLMQQKKKQEEDLESLRKEVTALQIMKTQYEQIVKAHQNTPQQGQNQVSDECKFQVFQQIMDSLFQSFNASISVANFGELSSCVFSWLEEYCKPQMLRDLTLAILSRSSNLLRRS